MESKFYRVWGSEHVICLDVVDEVRVRPGVDGKNGFVVVKLPLVTRENASGLQDRRGSTFQEHPGFEWPQLEIPLGNLVHEDGK